MTIKMLRAAHSNGAKSARSKRRWNKKKLRTLHLHIGLHKTGTSSLQKSLSNDSLRLRIMHGIRFFNESYAGINLNKMISWGYDTDVKFQLIDSIYNSAIQDLQKGNSNIIISSEDLSLLQDDAVQRMSEDLNEVFSNINIIIYLRRQDRMAVSLKLQGVKTPQQMLMMGAEDSPLPINLRNSALNYLSYDRLLIRWKNSFPRARIIIRKYNRSDLIGKDTVTDFYSITDFGRAPRRRLFLNASPSEMEARSIWKLKRGGISIQDLNLIWRSMPHNTEHERFLPTEDEARQFMSIFRESNMRLGEIVGDSNVFDSKFEEYPATRILRDIDPTLFQGILKNSLSVNGISNRGRRIIAGWLDDLPL